MKNVVSFVKMAWNISPSYVLLMILNALLAGGKIVLNALLPAMLIDELLGSKDINMLILYGSLLVLNNVLTTFIVNSLNKYVMVRSEWLQNVMVEKMGERIMNLEYSYLETPYYLDLKEKAIFAIQNQNVIGNCITLLSDTLQSFFTLAGLLAILVTLGPVLIIVIAISMAAMMLLYKSSSKSMVKLMQEIVPINRIFGYYIEVGLEKPAQKDIRLFGMNKMITDKVVEGNEGLCDRFDKGYKELGVCAGGLACISEFVSAFTYCYVGIRTVTDTFGPKLSLGSLTMYVSSAISFSTGVAKLGEKIANFWQMTQLLAPYNEFMEIKEETISDGGEIFTGEVETVEFKNVTFTYPRCEKPILRDISFKINRGEKISIVGLNGAGKSTLVKLICRMYKTDSGEILVNGKNIYDYDYMSYMNVISAIFQDYRLFNFTIAENISCKEKDADEATINRLIKEVGLEEKIKELPEGIYSRFGKEYDENGVELSGGQGQKIAIARALYKKASMVILDEPASALDPIAEAEIYEKFNDLVEDKTAIYISHRMSSSVFCDKILIIDGGTISDFDTHKNLMEKKESLYYKLFMSQADNYKVS